MHQKKVTLPSCEDGTLANMPNEELLPIEQNLVCADVFRNDRARWQSRNHEHCLERLSSLPWQLGLNLVKVNDIVFEARAVQMITLGYNLGNFETVFDDNQRDRRA